MSAREKALKARRVLLNGNGKLAYFRGRGIGAETIKGAWVGYDADQGAFTYPSIARGGGLLGIHYKSETRNAKGKRSQWWDGYSNDLPPKRHGKKPDDMAKIIPFGMETLKDLKSGSLVVLCCGEEDTLSMRQMGYTSISQPGAGLLEPVYAKEFADLDVVVFYDAGEENEARKDALKLREAGAQSVRVVEWPPETTNGADINGRLVEDPEDFKGWVERMLAEAVPLGTVSQEVKIDRKGVPDAYAVPVSEAPAAWPVLSEEALHGLPGDIVRAIEPHTEADPVALLANMLAAFGNAVGRGAYFRVGADKHHLKINVALVGETGKGRKGTSWGYPKLLMHAVDPGWVDNRILSGLSSGEGLIYAVRDRVTGNKNGEEIVVDEGVLDKRLLIMEGELASVLKVMSREGNTLSPVIREAWDDGTLRNLTKNSPLKATDAHVTIIGHITKTELLRHLSEAETANGFANRFLWLMVKRSKLLPFGGGTLADQDGLSRRLKTALRFGSSVGEISWGQSAKEIWEEVYGRLSKGKLGLFGAVIGRAEAQVVRLASVYAVMDRSKTIEEEHLMAALAVWDYADNSALYIFGNATGNPVADRIMRELRSAKSGGLTRTHIRDLFGNNMKADRIERALAFLSAAELVRCKSKQTGGRPAERWFAT